MKKNKLTVTIGIPAHNEEQTLGQLIDSVIMQNSENYFLDQIIILCDGCTDSTITIARMLANKFKKIKVITSKKRLGKKKQLEKLYRLANSDIVIQFDADVFLSNKFVISELVKKFSNKNVSLVGGINIPSMPRNHLENVLKNWIEIWLYIRNTYRNGVSIHNSLGCVLALRKNLYKTIKFKHNITDDDYTYFYAIKNGYKFAFAKNAVVNYMLPTKFWEFMHQDRRLISAKSEIKKVFGNWVSNHYNIPLNLKIKSLIKKAISNPILTFEACVFQLIVRLSIPFMKKGASDIWTTSFSTKNSINSNKNILNRNGSVLNLVNLFFAYIKGNKVINSNLKLPKFIKEYELSYELTKLGTKKDFRIAQYIDPSGKKVFVKIWFGPKNDFRYFTFINEISSLKVLGEIYNREKNKISKLAPNVKIPQFIEIVNGTNYLALITEFIDAKMSSQLRTDKKIDSYIKASNFLEIIGKYATPKERKIFAIRSLKHFVIMYPAFLAIALINFPGAMLHLLRGVPIFLSGLRYLKNENLVLCHRDLHFNNILVKKDSIYIIDLQYVAYSYKLNEFATILRYRWGIDGMERFLIPKIENFYKKNIHKNLLFNTLIVNSVTHGLTDKSYAGRRASKWLELLKLANSNANFKLYS